MSTIFKYPLDLLGTSPTNRVVNETHTIGATTGRLFAPDYGPFFGKSVTIVDTSTGRTLVPVDDYRLLHRYREASMATGDAVYAVVQVVNPTVGTELLFDGQYVGGEFSYSRYAIIQALEELQNDNRVIEWGSLVGVPSNFVPSPHVHGLNDLFGTKALVESNYEIASCIREGDTASMQLYLTQINTKISGLDTYLAQLSQCFADGAAELNAL